MQRKGQFKSIKFPIFEDLGLVEALLDLNIPDYLRKF